MNLAGSIHRFMRELKHYKHIVLDASAFRMKPGRVGRFTEQDKQLYKSILLDYLRVDERMVTTIDSLNELIRGYGAIYPNFSKSVDEMENEVLDLLEGKVISPNIADPEGFRAFKTANEGRKVHSKLGDGEYDTLAKAIYIARKGELVAFLSNRTKVLEGALHWVSEFENAANPTIYRVQSYPKIGLRLDPENKRIPPASFQDLAVLPAPKEKVELVHADANLA